MSSLFIITDPRSEGNAPHLHDATKAKLVGALAGNRAGSSVVSLVAILSRI
jgi:hypothetical protein